MGGRKGGSRTAPTPKGHPQGDAPTPGRAMTHPPCPVLLLPCDGKGGTRGRFENRPYTERAPTRGCPYTRQGHDTPAMPGPPSAMRRQWGDARAVLEPPLHRRAPTRGCPYTRQGHDTPAVPGPPSAMRRQWRDARAVHEPPLHKARLRAKARASAGTTGLGFGGAGRTPREMFRLRLRLRST